MPEPPPSVKVAIVGFMLGRLRNRHHGAVIAVIGAGPSARLFHPSKCDVSIGVNGAALLGCRFDYFQCSDIRAPERDWFRIDCSRSRVIAAMIASMDYFLYPAAVDDRIPRRAAVARAFQRAIALPEPRPPHFTYYLNAPNDERLRAFREKRIETLLLRASVAGQAVQLAYLMGAGQIDLYGCSFSQRTSGKPEHYFYTTTSDQIGRIDDGQIQMMNLYLSIIREEGVRVVMHGKSALSEYDEILESE